MGAAAERIEDSGVKLGGREAVGGGDMAEAHESVHERELPRIVELEAGDALPGGGDRRPREPAQLPPVDEGFDDGLTHGQGEGRDTQPIVIVILR